MLNRIIGLALILFSINAVQAEEAHYYIGVDWGDFGYNIENNSTTYDNANGFILRLGYDFNNWLAVEGHYADPDDFESSGSGNLSGNTLGAFARLNLRFKQTTLYAIGGAASSSYTGQSEITYAYGAGIDIYGSKDTALTIAYTSYYNDETASSNKIEGDALTFGITHYFGNRPRIYKRY